MTSTSTSSTGALFISGSRIIFSSEALNNFTTSHDSRVGLRKNLSTTLTVSTANALTGNTRSRGSNRPLGTTSATCTCNCADHKGRPTTTPTMTRKRGCRRTCARTLVTSGRVFCTHDASTATTRTSTTRRCNATSIDTLWGRAVSTRTRGSKALVRRCVTGTLNGPVTEGGPFRITDTGTWRTVTETSRPIRRLVWRRRSTCGRRLTGRLSGSLRDTFSGFAVIDFLAGGMKVTPSLLRPEQSSPMKTR